MKRPVDEILSKMDNGHERYQKSPLFNITVTQLSMGVGEIDIIDNLLKIADEYQEKIAHIYNSMPMNGVIKP